MSETDENSSFYSRLHEFADTEPSPRRRELHRLSDATRRIVHGQVNTELPIERLTELADALEEVAAQVQEFPARSLYEGFAEAANSGDPHAFFDHSPLLGRANPLAPPISVRPVDGRMEGTAVFGPAYEGPPGSVHGGFVAAAFDEVLGATQSLGGTPGMTGRLIVHYRSPTPLNTELRFVGRLDRVEGRKIFTTGECYAGETLTAEAEGLFISVDVSKFIALREARAQLLE